GVDSFIINGLTDNARPFMPESNPNLTNANLKRFMYNLELRIKKATSLDDLLGKRHFCVCYKANTLSFKVENGYLVKRCYTQGKKNP
ncbi:hypothetical protein AB4501_22885, partial [Vibrio sp. 10N.222.55.E8]